MTKLRHLVTFVCMGLLVFSIGACSSSKDPCPGCECEQDSDCTTGQTCDLATNTCVGECQEQTCSDLGVMCGTHDDGCGNDLDCGDCGPGFECNAQGQCQLICVPDCEGKCCGDDGCDGQCEDLCADTGQTCEPGSCECTGTCEPQDCAAQNFQCGTQSDLCGGQQDCGDCPAGEDCDANGLCQTVCVPDCAGKCCGDDGCQGQCPDHCNDTGQICDTGTCECTGTCEPISCVVFGYECGMQPDGCGDTQDCGQCSVDFACNDQGRCEPSCVGGDCIGLGYECGTWDDLCGNPIDCGQCAVGWTCDAANGQCMEDCVGETCADLGVECGTWTDQCGTDLDCGQCAVGWSCDAAGQCQDDCVPTDCATLGVECGTWPDGCGLDLDCGQCAVGWSCDAAGQCQDDCVPTDCATLGVECGTWPDGCGLDLDCGQCSTGYTCDPTGQCQQDCVPQSCAAQGLDCDVWDDGCGNPLDCGTCNPGSQCTAFGMCVENCVPDTCQDLGMECGQHPDGCGQTTNCGGCPGIQVCVAGTCETPCSPSCAGVQCGPDGCGGDCGTCSSGAACIDGQCISDCVPNCQGRECGPDGCGGLCGNCGGSDVCQSGVCFGLGWNCQETGQCILNSCPPSAFPFAASCVSPPHNCPTCVDNCMANTINSSVDTLVWALLQCLRAATCWPGNPSFPQCILSACPSQYNNCNNDCVPDCGGAECGGDGCGGSCGSCSGGEVCTDGICGCQPSCGAVECGPNGCGGQCAPGCGSDEHCLAGACQPITLPGPVLGGSAGPTGIIDLSWTYSWSSGLPIATDKFFIERFDSPLGFTWVATIDRGEPHTWQDIQETGTYTYRIRANDLGSMTLWSNEFSVDVNTDPPVLRVINDLANVQNNEIFRIAVAGDMGEIGQIDWFFDNLLGPTTCEIEQQTLLPGNQMASSMDIDLSAYAGGQYCLWLQCGYAEFDDVTGADCWGVNFTNVFACDCITVNPKYLVYCEPTQPGLKIRYASEVLPHGDWCVEPNCCDTSGAPPYCY